MENIREILSINLKKFRGKMSQKDLCKRAGISLRYYQDIEKSKTKWPQPSILEAIAEALNINSQELFSREKITPPPATIQELSKIITEQDEQIKKLAKIPDDIARALSKADEKELMRVRASLGLLLKSREQDKDEVG